MKLGKYDIAEDIFERNKQAFKMLLDTRSFEMVRMRSEMKMSFSAIGKSIR